MLRNNKQVISPLLSDRAVMPTQAQQVGSIDISGATFRQLMSACACGGEGAGEGEEERDGGKG